MHIAVDVGGTFTDLVLHDAAGQIHGYKSPTTVDDLTDGVFDGLMLIADARGQSLLDLLSDTARFSFGTTAATNAILEGNGVRTAKWLTEKVTTPLAYDVDDFLNTPSGPVANYDSQFDIARLETITNFLDRWMAAHKCLI